jgi:hypothetical protein
MSPVDTEGILGIPGDATKIKEIKAMFHSGSAFMDLSKYGTHDVAGALLLYIYELPEPVFTDVYYKQFLDSLRTCKLLLSLADTLLEIENVAARLSAIKELVQSLPLANQVPVDPSFCC